MRFTVLETQSHTDTTSTWVDFSICGHTIRIYDVLEALDKLVAVVVGGGTFICHHRLDHTWDCAATDFLQHIQCRLAMCGHVVLSADWDKFCLSVPAYDIT